MIEILYLILFFAGVYAIPVFALWRMDKEKPNGK